MWQIIARRKTVLSITVCILCVTMFVSISASGITRTPLSYMGYSEEAISDMEKTTREYGLPMDTLIQLFSAEDEVNWAGVFEALDFYQDATDYLVSSAALDEITKRQNLGDIISLDVTDLSCLLELGLSYKQVVELVTLTTMLGKDIHVVTTELKNEAGSDDFDARLKSTLEVLEGVFSSVVPKGTSGIDVSIQSTTQVTIHHDPIYGVHEVSPFMTYFKNQNESVNMETGSLSYTVTDLTLPGRGGLDLVIARTYTSTSANVYSMECTVKEIPYIDPETGEILYYNTYYYSSPSSSTYLDAKYGLGVGWTFNLPMLERTTDGALYVHLGNGATYKYSSSVLWKSNLENYYLADMYFDFDSGFSHNGLTSSCSLRYKDGLRYYFTYDGRLLGIRDRYGSTIRFEYTRAFEQDMLSRIIDSVGRTMDFVYEQTSSDTRRVTLTCGSKSIEYNLVGIGVGYKYKLESVAYKGIETPDSLPSDRTMFYSYDLQTAAFDIYTSYASSHEPADNKYLLLTTITHPTGGETRFGYQKYAKKMNDNDEGDPSWFDTFRLSSRRDILGGVQTDYRSYTYNISDSEGKYSRVYTYAQEFYDEYDFPSIFAHAYEKYYFHSDPQLKHLLRRKEVYGNGYKSVVVTDYKSDTKVPYSETLYKYAPNQKDYTTVQTLFGYDIYRNLLCMHDSDGHEVVSAYATNKYHVLESSRTKIADDMFRELQRTDIDSYGRINQELTKQTQKEGTIQETHIENAPIPSKGMNIAGDFWTWVMPVETDRLELKVDWFAAGPWQHADYSVWVRRIDSAMWTRVGVGRHVAGILSDWGTDSFNYDSDVPAIYEVKVLGDRIGAFGSAVRPISVRAISYIKDLVQVVGVVATEHEYDLTYKSNLTKTTIQHTHANINFEYDPVYHAYISHAYIEGVNNPYFNIYNEIIGNQYHYDYFGRVQRKTDARGYQVGYTYDNLDRIIREHHLSDWTSKLINYYDAANKVIVEDEEGYLSIFYYDQLGRPIAGYGDDGVGNEIKLYEKRYDQMGRVFRETDGDDVTTYYAYDAVGRIIKIIHSDDTPENMMDNPLTQIIYDDMDNRKVVIDPNGNIRVIEMDNSGNVLRVF